MTATTPEQGRQWSALADRLSADHAGHDVTVELIDPEGGDSSLVERQPFEALVYDSAGDVLVVSVGDGGDPPGVALQHVISHPTDVEFDLIARGAALKVTDASGTTTLISLLRRAGHDDA